MSYRTRTSTGKYQEKLCKTAGCQRARDEFNRQSDEVEFHWADIDIKKTVNRQFNPKIIYDYSIFRPEVFARYLEIFEQSSVDLSVPTAKELLDEFKRTAETKYYSAIIKAPKAKKIIRPYKRRDSFGYAERHGSTSLSDEQFDELRSMFRSSKRSPSNPTKDITW